MKIKTAELTGVALDWVVAKCEGVSQQQWAWYRRTCAEEEVPENRPHCYAFSTQWSAGGPVIERERIELSTTNASPEAWRANGFDYMERCAVRGSTPLIAAMRCFVASRFGDEVDIPEELA